MTLDLVQVAEQMPALLDRLVAERARNRERRQTALDKLNELSATPRALEIRLKQARTGWPVALPLAEPINAAIPPPFAEESPAYTVLATDGSHIDVDRHAPARCYVLNTGWAVIRYGPGANADLASKADLQPTAASLLLTNPDDASRDGSISGETLSLLRGVRELSRLRELVEKHAGQGEVLALLDGNLGLWNVEQAQIPKSMREELIHGPGNLRESLDQLHERAESGDLSFAAYTSRAGTFDVVNTLRVAEGVCDMTLTDCGACASRKRDGQRICDMVALSGDSELFWHLLRPGERSAAFRTFSRPQLNPGSQRAHWYEEAGHAVDFFYLRVDDEMARVEFPQWMSESPERLARLHALILDQCARGPGYPIALQEAHEAAVISMTDRLSFSALLERELAGLGVEPETSAKSQSKRVRGI